MIEIKKTIDKILVTGQSIGELYCDLERLKHEGIEPSETSKEFMKMCEEHDKKKSSN